MGKNGEGDYLPLTLKFSFSSSLCCCGSPTAHLIVGLMSPPLASGLPLELARGWGEMRGGRSFSALHPSPSQVLPVSHWASTSQCPHCLCQTHEAAVSPWG